MMVLDTSVLSYIFDRDGRAKYYLEQLRGHRAFLLFQTLEELWFGAIQGNWGERRRNELALHLEHYDVVWPDRSLVTISAQLRRDRQSVGRPLSIADVWIAATALLLDCPLASHDRDFKDIPKLQLIQAS